MSAPRQRQAIGQFELPLAAREAMWLFTPEGERAWVPGWDPAYQAGRVSEAAGTVFTTSAGGIETTWVIVELDRPGGHARYARFTPDRHAGTVRVSCTDTRPGHCEVTVLYEMTAIGEAGSDVLDPYSPEQFEAMLEQWRGTVERYLDAADRS